MIAPRIKEALLRVVAGLDRGPLVFAGDEESQQKRWLNMGSTLYIGSRQKTFYAETVHQILRR